MRVLVCPDKFRGSMTSRQAAAAIAEGVRRANPGAEVDLLPLADGGEGTVESLVAGCGGRAETVEVSGPLGGRVTARLGFDATGLTAFVAMSEASGLALLTADARNPLRTSTRGTGELIRAALDGGVSRIIVGLGGSGTNDGGAGMLEALGVRLLDCEGKAIPSGGGGLAELASADFSLCDRRLCREGVHRRGPAHSEANEHVVSVAAACDVQTPLIGPQGASAVFGPQKGATPEMVETLDRNLAHFARVIARDGGLDASLLTQTPGSGAAGGVGAGLLALGATLEPGADLILDVVGFDARLAGADLVITGEGRLDQQTAQGKLIAALARRCKTSGVPLIAFAGSLESGWEGLRTQGLTAAFAITPEHVPLDAALRNGVKLLTDSVGAELVDARRRFRVTPP